MKKIQRYTILITFLLLAGGKSFAQNKNTWKLFIHTENETLKPTRKDLQDSASWKKEAEAMLDRLHKKGYAEAVIDSISFEKNREIKVKIHTGSIYKWKEITADSVSTAFLNHTANQKILKNIKNQPFVWADVEKLTDKLLIAAENNGYPFAKLKLDSFSYNPERETSAKLTGESGRKIYFGKTQRADIPKKAKLTDKFLIQLLGIKKGEVYDESKIKKISSRLRELPYLEQVKQPEIYFLNDHADIVLYIKNRRASKVDFLLGLQPGSDALTNNRKMSLTGNVGLDLYNAFGGGERVEVKWQQIKAGTQDLKIRFNYPYMLGLPFGIEGDLGIYKQDTFFRTISGNAGLQYLFEGANFIKVFWENSSNDLLSVNKAQIIASKRLPARLDASAGLFGAAYSRNNTDYRFNPRKGWLLNVKLAAGIRKIKENILITSISDENNPNFDFSTLYDSLKLKSNRYKAEILAEYYLPFAKQQTLKIGFAGASLFQKQGFYENELYRIGGNRLLRGFDEESLPVSSYGVMTLEWRFLFAQNSFFSVFADGAYTERKMADNTKISEYPYGFGAGLALETKIGVFALSYALGARQNLPLQVRNAKVHFGYLNYF